MPDVETLEPISVTTALALGLTSEEYEKILAVLGRTPTYTELGIYSVMWSEHCSYKNSISELKTLPRSGGKLLVEAGEENAGLVDIGDGLAVAFKIESHNHPSAVEPFQGAATGVGGILRDIFTMGARPIAALNSLRFGPPDTERVRYLIDGVVRGISHYGNSFGVPTIGGEVYFEECYRENPLVNAMAIGIVKHSLVASAAAKGVGNPVMIVGSRTGRDGIHGASLLASRNFNESTKGMRPTVQVGDPFTEKLLLEATLEAIESGAVVGIQDMGAAGISCSTSEMSARTGVGMNINLDLVPLREGDLTSYEIMLSESQERMLVVAKRGEEKRILDIFDKWDLECVTIGEVTDDGNVHISYHGETVANIPAISLALGGEAPVYHREAREPKYLIKVHSFNPSTLSIQKDNADVLKKLLSSPTIASKEWIYRQYDYMVRTNTVVTTESDAAVVRIKGTTKALAATTDCNARFVYLNPYRGAAIAVAEAARNIVCSGATPLGITNCLNFGDPYDPEVFWQFKEAVRGMGDACKTFGTPVTGGNVSFYNQSPEAAIYPTPVIGMVGLLDDVAMVVQKYFLHEGDEVLLLGTPITDTTDGIGGSSFLQTIYGKVEGDAPQLDLEFEHRLQKTMLDLANQRLLVSAHDSSDGGLAVCLAESSLGKGKIGAELNFPLPGRKDFALFAEIQSRIVVSVDPKNLKKVEDICSKHTVPVTVLGTTKKDILSIKNYLECAVSEIEKIYSSALGERVDP